MVQFFRKKLNQKGFTLIELLVVIGIIGVLAAIAIPAYQTSQASSNGSKVIADLRTLDSAITQYQAVNGAGTVPTFALLISGGFITVQPNPPTGTKSYPTAVATSATALYTIGAYTPTNGVAQPARALYDGHPVEYYVNM
ncbi:MAG: prepilin-type N-terminal cleavage/methylation domain-containing protein [Negativicutes bacterium]|nr:prepilin-type N-terminal cleavage/methylation domain-containing protein [Negativicutes bacterium]